MFVVRTGDLHRRLESLLGPFRDPLMHRNPASRRLALCTAVALTVGAAAGCARQLLAHDPGHAAAAEESCMRTDPSDAPVITWRRTGTDADARILDGWCAAVGPGVFDHALPTP